MELDTQADRRQADRRTDGVTARILRRVFSMRRGVDDVSARSLLASTGHDPAFIERVLAIPEERRGQPRRSVVSPVAPGEASAGMLPAGDDVVSLGADDMVILHRLRFESETGMHRLTMEDCPADFTRFGLVDRECDGTPTITLKGRQALRHFACVRALDSVRLRLDAVPMSDEVTGWLEANGYLERKGNGSEVTARGLGWLEMHLPLAPNQTLS